MDLHFYNWMLCEFWEPDWREMEMRTKGLQWEYKEEWGRERDQKQTVPFTLAISLSGACPQASCLTLRCMTSPSSLEFALIVGCIVASQMINRSCQKQNVKTNEIQVHSINNLGRILIPPSSLFSPLPSLHSHSFVYVCLKETNEISDAAMNRHLKTHPRVPVSLCSTVINCHL